MLTWIVTSILIAGFSAVLLKLLDETRTVEGLRFQSGADGRFSRVAQPHQPSVSWQSMTDADLDTLLAEFSEKGVTAANRPQTF